MVGGVEVTLETENGLLAALIVKRAAASPGTEEGDHK